MRRKGGEEWRGGHGRRDAVEGGNLVEGGRLCGVTEA